MLSKKEIEEQIKRQNKIKVKLSKGVYALYNQEYHEHGKDAQRAWFILGKILLDIDWSEALTAYNGKKCNQELEINEERINELREIIAANEGEEFINDLEELTNRTQRLMYEHTKLTGGQYWSDYGPEGEELTELITLTRPKLEKYNVNCGL